MDGFREAIVGRVHAAICVSLCVHDDGLTPDATIASLIAGQRRTSVPDAQWEVARQLEGEFPELRLIEHDGTEWSTVGDIEAYVLGILCPAVAA